MIQTQGFIRPMIHTRMDKPPIQALRIMWGRLRSSTLGSSQRVVIATMCSMAVLMGFTAERVTATTTAEAAAAEIATKCCPTAVISPSLNQWAKKTAEAIRVGRSQLESPSTDAKIKRFIDFIMRT